MRLSEEIFKKEKFPYVKGTWLNGGGGYDANAVELYLEDVAVKVEKLEDENAKLKDQIKALTQTKELRGETVMVSQTPTPPVQVVEAKEEVVESVPEMSPSDTQAMNSMKEQIKLKLNQIEVLERSYKRMLLIAEQEAQEIKQESRIEATKLLKDAQEKAESLIREANNRFTEREREMHLLNSKADELKERLKNVAQFIEEAVS